MMKAPPKDQIEIDNNFFQYMISLLPPQLITDKEPEDCKSEDEQDVKNNNTKGQKRKNADVNPSKGHNNVKKKKNKKQNVGMNGLDVVETGADSMEVDKDNDETRTGLNSDDLQTKLKKKLETLRAMRCKPGSAERQEQNRLKRRLSKTKLKERRKQEKQAKNSAAKTVVAADSLKTESENNAKSKTLVEDKIMFSKFDFSNSTDDLPARGKQKKKSKSDLPTGKNYKQLLERAAKQKEKLETLEKQDQKKAQELKEKILWKTALSKAEGVKVKDDIELIKKSLKKKEQKSERSKKKWKEREAAVEKKMKARQDKRKTNLAKRKDMKKEKRIKKSKKMGRLVTGN